MLTGIVLVLGAIGVGAIFVVLLAALGLGAAFGVISQLRRSLRPARQVQEWVPPADWRRDNDRSEDA